jgi:hypothetical protein
MEPTVDLDGAAAVIESRRDRWQSAGVRVGPTTWTREQEIVPYMLRATVRSELQDPESVEVHLHGAHGRDVLIELSRGGDLVAWGFDGRQPVIEEVAVTDLKAFGQVLDAQVGRFLALGVHTYTAEASPESD